MIARRWLAWLKFSSRQASVDSIYKYHRNHSSFNTFNKRIKELGQYESGHLYGPNIPFVRSHFPVVQICSWGVGISGGRPESCSAALVLAIFSLSSLSAPPPALHPLPLSPQGEQFCSATHCAIFGSLCYLLFKDAVAVCWCIKEIAYAVRLSAFVCMCVCADQRVCVYPT